LLRAAWAVERARAVIGAGDRDGCIIDVDAGTRVTALAPLRWYVLSSRGDRVLVAPAAGGIELRDTTDGAVIRRVEVAPGAAAFSDDGTRVVLAGDRGLEICDADRGIDCRVIGTPDETAGAVLAGPDRLVTRTMTGAYRLREPSTGRLIAELGARSGCTVPCVLFGPADSLAPVRIAERAAAPPRIAIPELVGLWDAQTGARISITGCRAALTMGAPMPFVGGGHAVLSGGCVIDAATGRMITEFNTSPTVSPDGRFLGGWNEDSLVARAEGHLGQVVFDVASEGFRQFDHPLDTVWRFSRDGAFVVERAPRELRVLSTAAARTVARLPVEDGPLWGQVVFSEDGSRVVFSDLRGTHELPLGIDELRRRLAASTKLCLSAPQRQQLLEESPEQSKAGVARCPR
jgi:hypothetical protein